MPARERPRDIEQILCWERYLMELLLLYEVKEWEVLFWNEFKAFLGQPSSEIGSDRVEEKERMTREWRVNCWKRLNSQMHAAEKRIVHLEKDRYWFLEFLWKRWASTISQLFEGVEKPNSISLSELRNEMEQWEVDEIHLRMEKEIEDTKFRLKLGMMILFSNAGTFGRSGSISANVQLYSNILAEKMDLSKSL